MSFRPRYIKPLDEKKKMSPHRRFLFFLLLLLFFTASSLSSSDRRSSTVAAASFTLSACNGTDGRRCLAAVEEQLGGALVDDSVELQFDSEINRRLLAETNRITNGALDQNRAVFNGGSGLPYDCAGKCGGGGRPCGQKYHFRCPTPKQ